MNIAMFTNTFTPHVGGVARSVQGLADELRRMGHAVLVVAPSFEGSARNEPGVLRVPAVQHFNGSDFSLPVPVFGSMSGVLEAFRPDVVHSHHPFLLGYSALRIAAAFAVPIVFTHHTRYEQYTHYVPGDSSALKHFVIELVTGYCNLCSGVIAPSGSIADILVDHGVKTAIQVIPTGVDPLYFEVPESAPSRQDLGIPEHALVLGHVGRLAPEKNLHYLAECISSYLHLDTEAHFLMAGEGAVKPDMLALFESRGVLDRIHSLGVLSRTELAGIYRLMDLFAFTSCSETQGLVLAEAMAAGTPVIAVDAPGVRDVIVDFRNGRLLAADRPEDYVGSIAWFAGLDDDRRQQLRASARSTAEGLSLASCSGAVLALYRSHIGTRPALEQVAGSRWHQARKRIRREFEILGNYGHAIEETIRWIPLQKKRGIDLNPT
ncbi:MAG: glycosyltransferase [Desulfofustis sp.]|nr:glycosyltransferase [Desulfofustis sp.]